MLIDGAIFSIAEFQHVKPGKGSAFVRTKLKNMRTGAVLDRTFRSGDKVDAVRGMNICITTTAKTDAEAKALLAAFRFPFKTERA